VKPAASTVFAFLAASAFPAVYQAVVYPLSGVRDLQSVLGTFFVAYYFAAGSAVVLGVPAYLLLERFKLVRWWSAMGCGILAGALVIVVITSNAEPAILFRFASLGGATGVLFWIVRRAGRT